jgi:arsenate reductase (thioredoxin)
MSTNRKKVLFLCTGNSCRSQMAEGWAKSMHAKTIDAYSAGTNPHAVNPLAVKVMAEEGVDICSHESKHLNSLSQIQFDLVVTVCDNAANSCPIPPKGTRVIHAPFEDPPQLAKDAKSEDQSLPHYRRVRDEIKDFISKLPSLI